MSGLPRVADNTRPREVFALMVLEPVERMTTALRRGDPFSAQALTDMEQLDRRLRAFSDALAARVKMVEDD